MNIKNKYVLLLCLKFAKEKLGVKTPFTLVLSEDKSKFATYAHYNLAEHKLSIYTKNRAIGDQCRSMVHELVHHWQLENDKIKGGEPDIGNPDDPNDIENEANSKAGSIIKEFGKKLKLEKKIDLYSL